MYLSDKNNLEYVLKVTGLALDELEQLVGRFRSDHHSWPNELKGELVETLDGCIKIIHHYTKEKLWELE